MKKLLTFIGIVTLTLGMSLTAFASPSRLVDDADLLTAAEESAVLKELDTVSNDIGMEVVVVTVPTLGGKSATDYAVNYHDTKGYQGNCTLFLICPEERDYAIRGFGEAYFSDSVFEKIADNSKTYLSDDNYSGAFLEYASSVKYYYEQATMNGGRGPFNFGKRFGISLVIGLIVGFITLMSLKGQLKSVYQQTGAADYTVKDSFDLAESRDHFLYSQTTRTEIPKNNSSSSASGSSYGGTSGKY